MASNANVSAVEANDNLAATRDNTETPATTTAAENTPTDNHPPSSSLPSAIEPSSAHKDTQLETDNIEGGSSQEKKNTEIEDKSSPNQPTGGAISDGTQQESTVATVIATPSAAPETLSSDIKSSEVVADGETSDPTPAVKETEDTGPELVITLLLTTGARHPFRIDRKYLRRRSVKVDNDDPFNMSVYTLKELIWREWRSEWEPQPSSPSSIRLIYFGKLLDDKSPLTESHLAHDAPNVIHMTVKPQEVVDEEDAKGGKSYSTRDRETTDRSPSCRCVIL